MNSSQQPILSASLAPFPQCNTSLVLTVYDLLLQTDRRVLEGRSSPLLLGALVLLVLGCVGISVLIFSAWMLFGVLIILFLHIFREQPKKRLTAYLTVTVFWLAMGFIGAEINEDFWLDKVLDLVMMMTAYFCMTVFYNGRKGRHPVFAKWFFYAFYPLHYLLIWLIERVTR